MNKHQEAMVVGGGLAGCEAAWQLAKQGIRTTLIEMRPTVMTPAHHTANLAELVCSNSLRSGRLENAVGLLKEEMRLLGSLILDAAEVAKVPAGGALAVDREAFSGYIEQKIQKSPLITLKREEVTQIPKDVPVIIATGPLSSPAISESIAALTGRDCLYFFDAAAPIVTYASIDFSRVFKASRYGKGEDDYINCPMDQAEYRHFYQELILAEKAELKEFEKTKVFDGCMPIEVMASRGEETMRFGPLKPVGLVDPRTGKEPYAVVQLRQDDRLGTLYNLVGFQTHLKFAEQKRVFSSIPGLAQAEFVRYGVMHRNTFIRSPLLLDAFYAVKWAPHTFFAGQITGVEGYVESASSGLSAGFHLARRLKGLPPVDFTNRTAIGALAHYVSNPGIRDFQPMNVNYAIIAPLQNRIKQKQERNLTMARRALSVLGEIIETHCEKS